MNSLVERLHNEDTLENEADKEVLRFSGKCIVTVNNRKSKEMLISSQGQRSFLQLMGYKLNLFLQGKKATLVITEAP